MFAGILRRNFANPEGYSTFAFGDLKKEIPFPTSLVVVSMAAPVVINASVTTTTSRARAFKDPPRTGGDTYRSTTVSSGLGSHKHRHLEPIDLDKEFQIGVRYQTLQDFNTLSWTTYCELTEPGSATCTYSNRSTTRALGTC